MPDSPAFDPLGTPERRREAWANIAFALATADDRPEDLREGAHMALDFAMRDDPPREWPEGSYGARLLAQAQGQEDPSDG